MSQVVIHNKTVYLAGQVAAGARGKSVAEQTKDILSTIDALLAEAKTDKSRILNATIWLTDMAAFAQMNGVWDAWVVSGATPARATVVSTQLASPEFAIEIAVIAAVAPHLPKGVELVPAHPVAGTEQSGPDAGFATLFVNRWCILTPADGVDPAAIAKVRVFWEALGSNVETMNAAHHDLVLAITSHVPHLIAYNIVGTASDLEETTRSEVIKFSAGGFRDFTRIAASDPTMWRDVFLNNKQAVLEALGRFSEDLTALQRMIRYGDGEGLFALFARTRAIRRGIVEMGQETAAPDFGRPHDEDGDGGS